MRLENQNILFLTRTMKLGGTENVVLQLCEIFKPLVNKVIVCSCGGINEEELKTMGIRHYIIPDMVEKNPYLMIKTFLTIKNIVKKEKITIVHSHHRMAALYAEVICGKNIEKIANAHNTFHDKKRLTKFAYQHTRLIAVGEMVKKNLVDFYEIKSENVTVIHNAIKPFDREISLIPLLTEYRENGYKIIGNVGRLSEQKGMEYFIDAAPKVLDKFPMTKFVIVGDGEDKEKLVNLVQKKHLQDSIIFLGYRSDIQNVISQMDFIVLSSLWEGLPLTPIEAFSVGKTVIATAVDGTPEIVDDNINGLLVRPKDSKDLGKKICYLLENPEVEQNYQKNARKKYDNEFSFVKLKDNYVDYYKGL